MHVDIRHLMSSSLASFASANTLIGISKVTVHNSFLRARTIYAAMRHLQVRVHFSYT